MSNDASLVVLVATLKTWRGLFLMTLPPLGVVLMHHGSLIAAGMFLAIGAVWYHCWRLWLDQCYFSALQAGMTNEALGQALANIWQRPRLHMLTLAQRQQGALRCLKRSLLMAAGLWVITAGALWWGYSSL